jgi:AraC-like DNA-binding protein
VIRLLDANPHLSIEDLARQMGRPTAWMARMFASAVGMSMRDYQGWLRQRRVFDLLYTPRSLTEVAYDAGFGDSPQFSRTFQRWYGVSPSHSRDPRHVRVFVPGASNRMIDSAPEHSDDADHARPRSRRD